MEPKINMPDFCVVSRKRTNALLARGGVRFMRNTTSFLDAMGKWEGEGMVGSYGREN